MDFKLNILKRPRLSGVFFLSILDRVNYFLERALLEWHVMGMIQTYGYNRDKFCERALKSGAKLYHMPYVGFTDVDLATDIAVIGDNSASKVVVMSSGLHGVELPAGSVAQQIGLDAVGRAASHHDLSDTKFVFVHALNPNGAYYALRTDQDLEGGRNIDPARNFINFASADFIPTQADTDISNAFDKANLSSPSLGMMWGRLLYTAFVKQGQAEFKRNFVQGQYTNPSLPYYGGQSPCCARTTWQEIITTEIIKPAVKKIWHFDCHTGDGPFGVLQLYLDKSAGEKTKNLAQKLIAPDKVRVTDEYFANVTGDIGEYWKTFNFPPEIDVYPITLEFGTTQAHIPGIDILGAILNRTLLSEKYNDDHASKDIIIQRMRTAFCPTQQGWAQAVITQSQDVWNKILHNHLN